MVRARGVVCRCPAAHQIEQKHLFFLEPGGAQQIGLAAVVRRNTLCFISNTLNSSIFLASVTGAGAEHRAHAKPVNIVTSWFLQRQCKPEKAGRFLTFYRKMHL